MAAAAAVLVSAGGLLLERSCQVPGAGDPDDPDDAADETDDASAR
jgi:hypothetical protein